MSIRNSVRPLVCAAALLAVSAPLAAQVVAPDAPRSTPTSDEALVLSPFVVNSDTDIGYQATSTLAGTRLNTPLKDIGASISVYTKNFLDDIGATSSADLLIYATGMEAAGAGGNFSGASTDINATEVGNESQRADPQQSSRTRGLAAPNFTRGFFVTSIAFDSYNTDTVTVSRGPNSLLFGVGSPAGVVDTSLIRADVRRNKNKVVMRYGNNDSVRGSVDFNRVLIDRKLAVRIAALHNKEEYNQRPAFEEQKRLYGALTFEPYKSTSLRANFETGRTRANRPITVLPINAISDQWYAAGRPGYDWSFYDDPARNPNARTQTAGSEFMGFLISTGSTGGGKITTVFSSPSATEPAFAFKSSIPSGSGANQVQPAVFHPLVNRDLAGDSITFGGTTNIFNFPGAYWTGANVLPGQLPGLPPAGIKQQGFTDFSVFDFRNRMIDEMSRQGNSFHTFNIALEQRAWRDRVGIELAYDRQRIDARVRNSFFAQGGNSEIRVDPNVTLPTGEPNPNLGRPFVHYVQTPWRNSFSNRESMRATGYLKYDFKDMGPAWSRWLGRHTLTALYEQNTVEAVNYTFSLVTDGPAAQSLNPNPSTDARRPVVIVYLGPSIIGNNNPLQLEPIRIPQLRAGPTVAARYFERSAAASDPGRFIDAPNSLFELNRAGSAQREVIKSQAVVLQSYWWQNQLVTTGGWRRDEDYFAKESFAFVSNPADLNDPGKVHYGFNDFTFPSRPPPNAAKEILSYSAVLRWPQKLLKLPAGFSVYFNESENFTPIGGRVDGYGVPLPSPQGRTKEYGFNVWTFDDKFSARVNWFETGVHGVSFSNAASTNSLFGGLLGAAESWATEANINPHLAAKAAADVELLFSPVPANFRQLYGFVVTGTAPNLGVAKSELAGRGDTTDFNAEGIEFELVYNPTRNWRIMANVANQETVRTNSLPFLKSHIARMLPVWKQLSGRPNGRYPLNWQIGDPLPASILTFGSYIDANVMLPFATALATEGSASAEQRKWRANLVTNYTFDRNAVLGLNLKGWSLGGAVRWQDKIGIGYPSTRNPDTSVNVDLQHPFYAPAETNVDAWVAYERKIWSDRIGWKINLNVRNIYGDADPIAIGVQPWGAVATARLAPERRWYLTSTFSF
ncbi:MAG: hypothetical protein Q7S40_03885 [Opitutaceae bacterium]|nr:hypothetical protein [Opitutaceae bacterium]